VTPTIDAGAPDHLAQANTALNPTDRNQR
jgi:hypothetical protein